MEAPKEYLMLETEIVKTLKSIYDPEIPVNIYDLGLIYRIEVDDNNKVELEMTLTAPNCPIADSILEEVREKIKEIPGVTDINLILVFDPPWTASMMTEEARLELGFM
jgi:FeS assembly SUF system protein